MADGESPPLPSPPPLGAPDHASSGEEDNSPRHVPLATKAAQPRTHNKDHSEKLAGAAGNAPELLPTWMSFEEKALAQGIQLMDLQRSATFEPPKLSPPPAAAQPAFSFSVLETDSDRPRPKPLTNAKKSPDKRHKNPPLKGEERMKTLYERKWESYNAILATTKLNSESGAPDAPLAIAAPAAAAPAVAAPDTEHGNAKPNKGRRNPKFPPVPGAANGVQPVVQLPPMPKAAPLAFSLQAQALAPRIDVVRPQLAAGGAVEMAGDEPSVSLAFCPEPELRISQLPYNIRTLTLTGVNLPVMPQQLFNLTALTRLNYSMNEMKDVPSDIGRLTNLVHLDLSDNKLASLPPNIGALVKIQRLFLHQNHFIALPSSIGRLRSLVQFYLHSNALTTLPQETGSLTKLEELLLQENHLKELPTSLGQLSKLRLLNISYNSDLTRLPQSLGRLHGVLTNLICDSVPLDKRPPDLKWLAQQPPEVSVGASTYAADLATLVNRNDFSDLKIHCDGPVVLAHRAIVSARAARVALPATAGEPLSKQVSTPDVATVAVRLPQPDVVALLNYVYGANLPALKHHPEYMAPAEATSDAPAAASPPTPATAVGALAEDLRALLASGAFSDLTLRAEGVDFRVHKAILSCRCSYWANLFASGMKESREAVLPVEDLSAAGLRLVLTYLYTDNCTLDGDIAVEILQAADRYQLRRLTEMVECFLAESLEVDNMLDLWELSDSYHAEQLNRRCLHQLASGNKWSLVRKTEAYARLETNAPLKQKLMKALSTQPILFI